MSALPVDPEIAAVRLPSPPPVPLHPRRIARVGAAENPLAPTAPGSEQPARAAVPASPPSAPADPERWFGSLALAVVEVLAGGRAAQQLVRWVTPEIYGAVARRAGLQVRLHGRPSRPVHGRVLSARATTTETGSVEVIAVIHDGRRVRAVAGRLESFRDRWRVVELQIG